MTNSERMRLSAVMISSTIPSAKYSCSGSPLILANGSTAIDGLSGNGNDWGGARDMSDGGGSTLDPVHPHRPGDVFDLLLASILEGVGEPVANMVADRARDADAARFGQRLQPGRHIHPVAEDVVLFNDYVAEVD